MSKDEFKKAIMHVQCAKIADSKPNKPDNTNNSQSQQTVEENPQSDARKPNYKVKKGEGYTQIIKRELEKQGIEPAPENIKKAKEQFEQLNPNAVQTYSGSNKTWQGNKFLYINAEIYIPKFDI